MSPFPLFGHETMPTDICRPLFNSNSGGFMQCNFFRAILRISFVVGSVAYVAASSASVLSLDPRATYLLNTADSKGVFASNAVAFSLSALGLSAGDSIFLQRVGDYQAGNGIRSATGLPFADDSTSLIGVFSSSNVLLSRSTLNRVQGAIDAGLPERVTQDPFYGTGFTTDITEDFDINNDGLGVAVIIPTGANYIFFSAFDRQFVDNSDPDGDFGVSISAISAVPEPATCAMLALGLGMLGMSRRRSAQS